MVSSSGHDPENGVASPTPDHRKNKRRRKKDEPVEKVLLSGLAGGIAGCVAKTAVAPLDRVKILFQTGEPAFKQYAGSFRGAVQALGVIWNTGGVRGLLQGHSATLYRIAPYSAIKFMAYDTFHAILMPRPELETSLRLYTAGALSGVTSVFFTYPLDLLRVRLAFETHRTGDHRISLLKTAKIIYRESASTAGLDSNRNSWKEATFRRFPILNFYRGYLVSIGGVLQYGGVSFLLWGRLQNYMKSTDYISEQHKKRYRTLLDLGCGAIAGALSQTGSYPFEVIRRRMQVGGLAHPDRLVGFRETIRTIYRTNGLRGFFIGLGIGYVKIIPMSSIAFATWKGCKRLFEIDD